jgi:hypothetical protein
VTRVSISIDTIEEGTVSGPAEKIAWKLLVGEEAEKGVLRDVGHMVAPES